MNLIENLFQITASVLFKIGHHIKIDTITQYRVILSTVALAQTLMVVSGFYFLFYGKILYPYFDDIPLFYVYVYTYLGVISILTASQWRLVLKKKSKILPWRNTQKLSNKEKLQELSKIREAYSFAVIFTAFISIIFWLSLKENTELIALFMIPAFFEISANTLATSWEIALLSESQTKTVFNR